MLKDKTPPFGRVRKVYILKFMHIEMAFGGDSHSKILEQVSYKILQLDLLKNKY